MFKVFNTQLLILYRVEVCKIFVECQCYFFVQMICYFGSFVSVTNVVI